VRNSDTPSAWKTLNLKEATAILAGGLLCPAAHAWADPIVVQEHQARRTELGPISLQRIVSALRALFIHYSGHYFGASDSLFAGLVGRLEQVNGVPPFADAFRFFPSALDETSTHSGVLPSGSYSLILVSDPLPVIAPGETNKIGGFDFTFGLAPVAATPEPGTIVLLGLGLAAIARRALPHSRSGTGRSFQQQI